MKYVTPENRARIEQKLQKDPNDAEALRQAMVFADLEGDEDRTKFYARSLLRVDPGNINFIFANSDLFEKEPEYLIEVTLSLLRSLDEGRRDAAENAGRLAALCVKQLTDEALTALPGGGREGLREIALRCFETSIAEPRDVRWLPFTAKAMAKFLVETGRAPEALEVCEGVLRRCDGSFDLILYTAWIAKLVRSNVEAIRYSSLIIDADDAPQDTCLTLNSLLIRGACRLRMEDLAGAIADLNSMIDIKPCFHFASQRSDLELPRRLREIDDNELIRRFNEWYERSRGG